MLKPMSEPAIRPMRVMTPLQMMLDHMQVDASRRWASTSTGHGVPAGTKEQVRRRLQRRRMPCLDCYAAARRPVREPGGTCSDIRPGPIGLASHPATGIGHRVTKRTVTALKARPQILALAHLGISKPHQVRGVQVLRMHRATPFFAVRVRRDRQRQLLTVPDRTVAAAVCRVLIVARVDLATPVAEVLAALARDVVARSRPLIHHLSAARARLPPFPARQLRQLALLACASVLAALA